MQLDGGQQAFTGDGTQSLFQVPIPAQADTNFTPVASLQDADGQLLGISWVVLNFNASVIRIKFETPPALGANFTILWLLFHP